MSIPLHKDRGLDPHLTYCPRCGGDGIGITLGELRKAEVEPGQFVYANRGATHRTRKELQKAGHYGNLHWEEVKEGEKVPDNEPCAACKTEIAEHKALVAAGGIYFKCVACSAVGIIKAGTELAEEVRKRLEVPTPKPCGVEFTNCEGHTPKSNV